MKKIFDVFVANQTFGDWLLANLWWIGLILGLLVVAIILLCVLHAKKKKPTKPDPKPVDASAYLTALGGVNNIISKEVRGSRINLVLKDYKEIDEAKLKEAGVDGIVMMSDKLTLVVKENASKVFETLFGNN